MRREDVFVLLVVCWPALLCILLAVVGAIVANFRRSRTARVGAALLAAVIIGAGWGYHILTSPYTAGSALGFYEGRAASYDAVARYLLEQDAQSVLYEWDEELHPWPEEIRSDLEQILNRWDARTSTPTAQRWEWPGRPAVLFRLYLGNKRDSGDGSPAWDVQYLVCLPEGESLPPLTEPAARLEPLTGNWYLYTYVLY